MLKINNKLAAGILAAYTIVSFINPASSVKKIFFPITSSWRSLTSLKDVKNTREVFGFAPYWNFDKLDNIDFDTLTTLAYFDVKVDAQGNLIKDDPGYNTFLSRQATDLFKKAHRSGTRVVLTLTQMDPWAIEAIMDNPEAQQNLINQAVDLVAKRGIDGINVDFEYGSDPGQAYRDKFSNFVADLTREMHNRVTSSRVTVAVYASAVKDPKIYDIKVLAQNSDGIFMMAYDFAVADSDTAMPTSPLYGHKEGKYWYDVSTAVSDFLTYMPSQKLILGIPWYGYNYPVAKPGVKSETAYWGGSMSQTYATVMDNISPDMTGWDNSGKVGWRAYIDESGTWRMIFVEDPKSLKIKYDFAKSKNLGGVGIWALGNDDGKQELWNQLRDNFGAKLAKDINITNKSINDNI